MSATSFSKRILVGLHDGSDRKSRVLTVFSRLTSGLLFDTAKNIVDGTLFLDGDRLFELLDAGSGATCIEQAVILANLLRQLDISCQIVHADVLDHQQKAKKFAFISLIHVPLADDEWLLLDPVRSAYYECNSAGRPWTGNAGVKCISCTAGMYQYERYLADELVWTVSVQMDLPEDFRRLRLAEFVDELEGVSPYGYVAPLFGTHAPERSFFFDPIQDEIVLKKASQEWRFDLSDWENSEEFNWLSAREKDIAWRAIHEMRRRPEAYVQMMSKMQGRFFERT